MLNVAGSVAKIWKIPKAQHIQQTPERLTRDADEQVRLSKGLQPAERSDGIRDMFEHFATNNQLRRMPFWIEMLKRNSLERDWRLEICMSEFGLADNFRRAVARAKDASAVRQGRNEHAFAAPNFMDVRCAGPIRQRSKVAQESSDESPLDGIS